MKSYKLIFKNILYLLSSEFISKFLGFIVSIYLARTILSRGLGILGFAEALFSYVMMVILFGFDSYATREIARDKSRMDKFVNNIWTLRFVIFTILFVFSSIFIILINKDRVTKIVLFFSSIGVITNVFTINWVFQAIEKMNILAFRRASASILLLAGVLLIVKNSGDVIYYTIINDLSLIINIVLLFIYYQRNVGRLKIEIDLKFWKELIVNSSPIFLSLVMIMINFYLPTLILGFDSTEEQVGLFRAAFKVLLLVVAPSQIVLTAFYPQLSTLYKDDESRLRLMKDYSKILISWGVLIFTIGLVFSGQIIHLLFGENFKESEAILRILLAACMLSSFNCIYAQPLIAWDKQKSYMMAAVAGAIAILLSSLILIPRYLAIGAAYATVSGEFFIFFVSLFPHFKFNRSIYLSNLLRVFIVAAVVYLLMQVPIINSIFWVIKLSIMTATFMLGLLILKVIDGKSIFKIVHLIGK